MPTARSLGAVLLALLAGCQGTSSSSSTSAPADSLEGPIATPDTHLFDLADSTQVWLVTGRKARASGGGECIERGIQLRKGPLKIPVPLLFTSTLPEVIDGKLVARVSKNCVSGEAYSIDPMTGQPTPLAAAAR